MNHKEAINSQDFQGQALVLSLKERIKQGVRIPLIEGALRRKNAEPYLQMNDFRSIGSERALLWFAIFYKSDLSGEDLWDIKVHAHELWGRSKMFIPVAMGKKDKQELSFLIRKNLTIDKSMEDTF